MENNFTFDIAFPFEGTNYTGWAKSSGKKTDSELPSSYHVVLNGAFFGNVSYNGKNCQCDTARKIKLVQKVGEQITILRSSLPII